MKSSLLSLGVITRNDLLSLLGNGLLAFVDLFSDMICDLQQSCQKGDYIVEGDEGVFRLQTG